jgi:hypothetical protein
VAITKVQSTTSNTTSIALSGVTAGNFLVLETSYYRGGSSTTAPTTPSDSNGTVQVAVAPTAVTDGSNVGGSAIWYVENTNSGTHTITGLESNHNSTLTEFSGLATSTSKDQTTSASSTVNAHTSQSTGTTGTTAQASELAVIALCLVSNGGAANVGLTDPVSGYTTLQVVQNDFSDIATQHAYQILSATGTQSATFNWTDNETSELSEACIATFKAAGGAAAIVPNPYIVRYIGGM